jgi:hypothetical protein
MKSFLQNSPSSHIGLWRKKNRKKKGEKKLTKKETLDFSDECNKKSHITTKKFKKFKRKLETCKKTTTNM